MTVHCAPSREGHPHSSPLLWSIFPWQVHGPRVPTNCLVQVPMSPHIAFLPLCLCIQFCPPVTPAHTSDYKDSASACRHYWCHLFIHSFVHSTNLYWTTITARHWSGCWENHTKEASPPPYSPSLNLTFTISAYVVVVPLTLRAMAGAWYRAWDVGDKLLFKIY